MQVIGRECVYYFHDMIVEMIKWGFQEGKTLFGFGYDFRQSNRYLLNCKQGVLEDYSSGWENCIYPFTRCLIELTKSSVTHFL